jgi:pre-rRNA-processing protein IPI1
MIGLADLFTSHPDELRKHTGAIIEKLAERISDAEAPVRSATRALLRDKVLPGLDATALAPFLPLLMAHICSAMTHLATSIRLDALGFLEALMEHVPQQVVAHHLVPSLEHYCDLLSQVSGSIMHAAATVALAGGMRPASLTFLASFAQPSSGRQCPHASTVICPGLLLLAMLEPAMPLPCRCFVSVSDTCCWVLCVQAHRGRSIKAQSLASLLKVLNSLTAFLDRAFGSGSSSGSGSGGAGSCSKEASAAAGQDSSTIMSPAGQQLLSSRCAWAPSGSKQAVQARSSASSSATVVHAAAGKLLSALFTCWAECNPAQLATQPEQEPAQALLHMLRCTNMLTAQLKLLPAQGASSSSCAAGWAGVSASVQQEQQVAEQLAEVVLPRLLPHFPAYAPVVQPGAVLQEVLVQYNLQVGLTAACCYTRVADWGVACLACPAVVRVLLGMSMPHEVQNLLGASTRSFTHWLCAAGHTAAGEVCYGRRVLAAAAGQTRRRRWHSSCQACCLCLLAAAAGGLLCRCAALTHD